MPISYGRCRIYCDGIASPSLATRANPSEVRRIFTMGLPSIADHGGQILFGPSDGYLYFMMGDGVEGGDPYNFAQNKKSFVADLGLNVKRCALILQFAVGGSIGVAAF